MARYFIENVKCGVDEGGMACGPIPGSVIGEVKIRTDAGDAFYFCLAEVMGIPNFYKTDRSTYDDQMGSDLSDELIEYLDDHNLGEIDYSDVYSNEDPEDRDLFRYITYIVRSGWDECTSFMEETKGKWLDEIEIPISEDEQEYLDEMDEEDEEDESE